MLCSCAIYLFQQKPSYLNYWWHVISSSMDGIQNDARNLKTVLYLLPWPVIWSHGVQSDFLIQREFEIRKTKNCLLFEWWSRDRLLQNMLAVVTDKPLWTQEREVLLFECYRGDRFYLTSLPNLDISCHGSRLSTILLQIMNQSTTRQRSFAPPDRKYIQCDAADCGAASPMMRCSRCHLVYYCSKTCQRNHWHEHKDKCVDTYKLKEEAISSYSKFTVQDDCDVLQKFDGSVDALCGVCLEDKITSPYAFKTWARVLLSMFAIISNGM